MVYLSHKLQNDPSDLAWRLCVGIMLMQIIVTALQLLTQVNLLSLMGFALAIFGLGSLLVGRESSPVHGEVSASDTQEE
ncbi:hypothetical protein CMPELA_20210 [Cupriavidus necator]|uniref:Uncharacterized protein n=1 Tax=Cupriavidus necator (strain ATCC 17699 / DSM 428 / KCTC 22496 / NCIMB 10442 / H16 / Stanier 337) TaxID=381666 RepID=A0AAE5ZH27_CUPNH|nr:hypothetical protein [Cupriavidus necator]QCC02983.1 hypothetical protein E6A55_20350 [Cupriavidus necator H16]QQB80040.1 hypothetical protein I6H87_19960 [Cupriavidus necator]WKA44295.1 hypothetical protein QWP09_20385 [Cupriavidus necator]